MFKTNNLSKLYPHLNFNNIQKSAQPVQAIVTPNIMPVVPKIEPIVVESKIETNQENTTFVETKPAAVETPTEIVPLVETIQSKIPLVEPVVELEDVLVETPTETLQILEQIKPIPSRRIKGPKQRESVVPVKGERGLQSQYSVEQRKANYLERLSKKSVKLAEKEVASINEVLESVNNDPDQLLEQEKRIKSQLRLINYAKYFT